MPTFLLLKVEKGTIICYTTINKPEGLFVKFKRVFDKLNGATFTCSGLSNEWRRKY